VDAQRGGFVWGQLTRWRLDAQTGRPAEVATYRPYGAIRERFLYDAINERLAPSIFAVPSLKGVAPGRAGISRRGLHEPVHQPPRRERWPHERALGKERPQRQVQQRAELIWEKQGTQTGRRARQLGAPADRLRVNISVFEFAFCEIRGRVASD
jgi:hypothetical protein